jgi:hypothetical protein
MKLQYHTDNSILIAFMCPVCERPYRSGTVACDLGNHADAWLARLCIECAARADEVLQVRMPASILAPGADPDDPEAPKVAVDVSTVIRIDVGEEVSCDDCPQRFIGVYPMLQHYVRDHLHASLDLTGWRARGR